MSEHGLYRVHRNDAGQIAPAVDRTFAEGSPGVAIARSWPVRISKPRSGRDVRSVPFVPSTLDEGKTVGGLADHPLSEDVRQLVLDHVESFEKLEVLMLLREHPERGWTPDNISARLSLSSSSATGALRALHGSRLLDLRAGAEPVFLYAPAVPELAKTVEELAAVWEHDRLSVVKFMATSALERVRSSAVRAFADAFSLGGRNGKGKKNG